MSNCDVIIGQVGPTFGRKGEVKVRPYTDHPEQFAKGMEVRLTGLPEDRLVKIEKAWKQKEIQILKFEGIDNISDAEAIRNAEVCISDSQLVPLEENEYYIDDLIGMDVVTTDGKDLGKITEILRSPANDVYVTEKAMIPALKDIVMNIDLKKRKMAVRPIEGLMQETKE